MSHWATSKIFSIAWKKAVPFFEGVYGQQMVISLKDLSLQTFFNVDKNIQFDVWL